MMIADIEILLSASLGVKINNSENKKSAITVPQKRHYNDTIFQLKQHVPWVNGPDSHFGMTQKLKYKIIVAQDIVGVKRNQTICSGFLSSEPTLCLLWNGGRRAKR